MRTLPTLLACAVASVTGPVAMAGHGNSTLLVDNDFDGPAEVWIDGRYEGSVKGDTVSSFAIRPGNRAVSIQRPSGFPLLVTRVHAHPFTQMRLDVDAPMATLAVLNPSYDRVWVRVDGQTVPLSPQQGLDLRVESGKVDLVVEVRDRYGSHVVERRTVWVEPGTQERVAVRDVGHHARPKTVARFEPPRPTYTRPPPSSCSMHTAVAWHDDDDDDRHEHRDHKDRWDD